MKTTLALFCTAVLTATAYGQSAAPIRQATCVTQYAHTPYAHTMAPGSPLDGGPPRFRWGWFGAYHHPPAPVMHRDYTQGWRQWYYRR